MKTFLPSVYGNAIITGEGGLMTPDAQIFAEAWLRELPIERVPLMRLDRRLVFAAQLHAIYLDSRTPQEIAERANVKHASHYGRDWSTPNERVRAQGYRLPSNYPIRGNHVESNARDYGGPLSALQSLLDSDAHRPHLLGETGFTDRVVYGFGCEGADYCCLICPEEP